MTEKPSVKALSEFMDIHGDDDLPEDAAIRALIEASAVRVSVNGEKILEIVDLVRGATCSVEAAFHLATAFRSHGIEVTP